MGLMMYITPVIYSDKVSSPIAQIHYKVEPVDLSRLFATRYYHLWQGFIILKVILSVQCCLFCSL